MNIYKMILDKILCDLKVKPYIIGINGVDTSGKTTFTDKLSSYLTNRGFKTQVINIDDFHNESKIRYQGKNPINSYFINAFNLNKLENQILKPIRVYGKLKKDLTLLNLLSDKFETKKHYDINEDTIVLIEGVLLYREPINKYFNLRLYLDIPFSEVLKRAIKRDYKIYGDNVINRYKYKYIPIQQKYIEEYRPREISDLVIDNRDFKNPKLIK